MTASKELSAAYLVTAGAYAIAMVMSAHPSWTRHAEISARYLGTGLARTASAIDAHMVHPDFALTERAEQALRVHVAALLQRSRTKFASISKSKLSIENRLASVRVVPSQAASHIASNAKAASTARMEELRGSEDAARAARSAASPHALTLVRQVADHPAPPNETASIPPSNARNPAEIIRVEERLRENLTREMLENFELFLYVSKADAGPWAQHMYVFRKQANGDLVMLYDWPVSTGREKLELSSTGHLITTATPPGYYELDPHRSYEHYRSIEWDQSMPYALFFNWTKDGNETGLAIHAATGQDVARLGERASAGCIHLSQDNARMLFTMIRSQYRGLAPRFAVNRRTGTMSNDGILLHDANGRIQMADGYKVLVFIEDYGGENVVAALY